jgi:hypothetical protein
MVSVLSKADLDHEGLLLGEAHHDGLGNGTEGFGLGSRPTHEPGGVPPLRPTTR